MVSAGGRRERDRRAGHLIDVPHSTAAAALADRELVNRITARDPVAFEALMRRYNTRLFRTARAILKDDAEAEDAVQDAYIDAYRHMADFQGGSQLGTWLVRITVNRALMRLRKQKRDRVVVPFVAEGQNARDLDPEDRTAESATTTLLRTEIRKILERRVDELPVAFRTVFILREVEEMSVDETAEALAIPAATVRTRLFRARALLRSALARDLDMVTGDVFGFAGARCDRIVAAVLTGVSREHA
jgi:RNA polymerase sigma-70 factor (ECF subfamily)